MEISITFVVLILCGILGIYYGGKKGFAKSVAGFISLAATMLMLGIFLRIYYTYTHKDTFDMVVAIILLIALGAVYGILRMLVKSVKAIANLPVIAIVDRLLGAVLGVLVVVVLYHIILVASAIGYLKGIGVYILNDVKNNAWLTMLAKYDVVEIVRLWFAALTDKFNMG